MITKTNFELGLCDMDTQDPEELDKLKVVHCAVTVDDMSNDELCLNQETCYDRTC